MSRRHAPVTTAIALALAEVALVAVGGIVANYAAPRAAPITASLIVTAALTVAVLTVVAATNAWATVGFTRVRTWRRRRLLVVPAVLALKPLLGGVGDLPAALIATYDAGYRLTAITEETWFRGVGLAAVERSNHSRWCWPPPACSVRPT